jgi:hypothetical protein
MAVESAMETHVALETDTCARYMTRMWGLRRRVGRLRASVGRSTLFPEPLSIYTDDHSLAGTHVRALLVEPRWHRRQVAPVEDDCAKHLQEGEERDIKQGNSGRRHTSSSKRPLANMAAAARAQNTFPALFRLPSPSATQSRSATSSH